MATPTTPTCLSFLPDSIVKKSDSAAYKKIFSSEQNNLIAFDDLSNPNNTKFIFNFNEKVEIKFTQQIGKLLNDNKDNLNFEISGVWFPQNLLVLLEFKYQVKEGSVYPNPIQTKDFDEYFFLSNRFKFTLNFDESTDQAHTKTIVREGYLFHLIPCYLELDYFQCQNYTGKITIEVDYSDQVDINEAKSFFNLYIELFSGESQEEDDGKLRTNILFKIDKNIHIDNRVFKQTNISYKELPSITFQNKYVDSGLCVIKAGLEYDGYPICYFHDENDYYIGIANKDTIKYTLKYPAFYIDEDIIVDI